MTVKFKRIKAETYDLNTIQDNVGSILDILTSNILSEAQLIEGIDLVSGDNNVNHKLNRKINGYIVVKKSAAVDIYDKTSDIPNRLLVLNSSGTATISLIVF